uniref:Acyltransferase 3 domain-containing protein n=2 Tax=Alexandrium catenella TaxID=2925 RepID=A0A7S1SDC9_ALECA|mmetsp:Transcript_96653/g.256864  ORF Transcript_96653/g.256864 Transcript_96653/m.256864 type:complete len:371 (+) Transcript_96653:87-1199(+)
MAQLTSLGFVQFLAAAHIFSYQLWSVRVGFFKDNCFQHWAAGWYSFLFASEGFRLTYAQLKGPVPEDMGPIGPYLCEKAVRLYPAYLISIALLAATESVPWSSAYVNVVPVFTWTGTKAGGWHTAWNGAGWVISDLAFHSVCWRFVYPRLLLLSEAMCWRVLCASLCFAYIRILAYATGISVDLVMWAPYTFCHFLCGMCLAKLFVANGMGITGTRDLLKLEFWPHRFACSALLSLTAFLLVIIEGPNPNDLLALAPHALWLGALMPFHLLLIWALALEEGPLAALCLQPPLAWLGGAANAMLVIHWNAVLLAKRYLYLMSSWPLTGKTKFAAVILPTTCAIAVLAHLAVERPLQGLKRRRRELLHPKDE